MPRRARLRAAGVALHIIQRGNNRGACFFAHDDYALYLSLLREHAIQFGCRVHAYVLMTNHVHLLLTPADCAGASRLMKHLGQHYVQHVNRMYRRSGTLWEGRFKSCLAQDDRYVIACYRYIELNPVRAGMVAGPGDYRWSSHAANACGWDDSTITPHEEYLRLGDSPETRRRAYCELFDARLYPELISTIRDATNGNVALGDRLFQAEIEVMLGRRAHRGTPGRPRNSGSSSRADSVGARES